MSDVSASRRWSNELEPDNPHHKYLALDGPELLKCRYWDLKILQVLKSFSMCFKNAKIYVACHLLMTIQIQFGLIQNNLSYWASIHSINYSTRHFGERYVGSSSSDQRRLLDILPAWHIACETQLVDNFLSYNCGAGRIEEEPFLLD